MGRFFLSGLVIIFMAGSAVAQPLWVPPGGNNPPQPPPERGQPLYNTPSGQGNASSMDHMRNNNLQMDIPSNTTQAGDRLGDLQDATANARDKTQNVVERIKKREKFIENERKNIAKRLEDMKSKIASFSVVGFVTSKVTGWVDNKINDLIQNNPITNKLQQMSQNVDAFVDDARNTVRDVRDTARDVRDTANDAQDAWRNRNNPPHNSPPNDPPPADPPGR